MYIIFGKELAESISDRHIILELETFTDANDEAVVAYCVVQPESIALGEISDIERLSRLHQHLADNLRIKNYEQCEETLPHLLGKFGGELDTFYSEITKRIQESKVTE
jgi:hypothetical protein